MKIKPIGTAIQLEIEEVSAGVLNTSSKESAVEYAKVLALGSDVGKDLDIKVGDHVFVKAFGIDIINHDNKKYHFCNLDTKAILAIVEE